METLSQALLGFRTRRAADGGQNGDELAKGWNVEGALDGGSRWEIEHRGIRGADSHRTFSKLVQNRVLLAPPMDESNGVSSTEC
jgi:hypothetical protein